MSGMELDDEGKEEEEEERSVTCRDIKLIMPTVLILLFTLFVMVLYSILIMRTMLTFPGDRDPVCIFISHQAASSSDGS